MEISRGRWRWRGGRCRAMLMVVAFLAISVCCVCSCCSGSGSGCMGNTVLLRLDFRRRAEAYRYNQEFSRGGGQWRRRRLLMEGPGSYPPRCKNKCGSCSPCYPLHVAVPPGVPVTTEYYPEAWRCKCGNRLYLP